MEISISNKCSFNELKNINEIIVNEKNPNKHSQKQIDIVCKNLKHQGWRHPLIISKRSNKLVVGHCRLEAAKRLGLLQVPVDYQDFDSEEQEMLFMIADNKLASLADHDDAIMLENIKELNLGDDFDFELFGLDDFKLLDVSVEIKEEPKDAEPKGMTFLKCPSCGDEFEKSQAQSIVK